MKNIKRQTDDIQFYLLGAQGHERRGMIAKFKYFARLSFANKTRHFHKRSTGKNQNQREAVTNLILTQKEAAW